MKNLYYLLLMLVVFTACKQKTYYQTNQKALEHLYSGHYEAASSELDKNKYLNESYNAVLLQLEKGRVAHLGGQYEQSNVYLNKADELTDSWDETRHRTIYGTNVAINGNFRTEWIGGFNSVRKLSYRTEDYEKVMIHYLKAINYIYLNKTDEALVEAKRLDLLVQRLKDKKFAEPGYPFISAGFPHMLMGIIYEYTRDYNNAFIAYEHASTLYSSPDHQSLYGIPAPEQLKHDILRTAKLSGLSDRLEYYEKVFGSKYIPSTGDGDLVVFIENGMIPHKEEKETIFKDWYKDKNGNSTLVKMIYTSPVFTAAADPCGQPALADKQSYPAETLMSFQHYTTQIANKRFDMETTKHMSNAKPSSAATERKNRNADTRSWQTLPASITYVRMPLQKGNNDIGVYCKGQQTRTISVISNGRLQIRNVVVLN